MWFRIAGAIAVALGGMWLGAGLAGVDARRVAQIDCLLNAFRALRSNIVHRGLPLADALHAVGGEGFFTAVAGALERGEEAETAWEQGIRSASKTNFNALTAGDWRLIREIALPISALGLEAQEGHWRAALERLAALREEAQAARVRDERIWRALGTLGGLALALLLL